MQLSASMDWSFGFPTKINFGVKAYEEIARQVGERRVLLITTQGFLNRDKDGRLAALLGSRLQGILGKVSPNPDVDRLAAICQESLDYDFDVIVAIGGGSVIDTAKVLAAGQNSWARSPEEMRRFLTEDGKVNRRHVTPVISVPTTSGTGSEVTPFATIWDNTLRKKFSIDGTMLYPEAAIVDPRLTIGLPEDQTIATGLDAVSQALESLWSKRATPVTMAIATQSLVHSLRALPRLAADREDEEARHPMALGSLLAGMAISQTRTGIAHSISYPLTAHYGLPHGIACAFTLPAVLEFNIARDDGRFLHLANAMGLDTPGELVSRIAQLLIDCNVRRRLRSCVPSLSSIFAVRKEMFTPGRADNNFAPINGGDLDVILQASFG